MKRTLIFLIIGFVFSNLTYGQSEDSTKIEEQEIHTLIDTYSESRTVKDSAAILAILTPDIDQLVSSGKWRKGIKESLEGMMQSSESNPGTRTLKIETIRFLNPTSAIVDARYEILNPDGSERKMWSTFIVVKQENKWKIAAIRNMLPSAPNN